MKFSIVIPTYNSEKFIDRCLHSIKDIDYPQNQYEIVVVDGKSRDKTRDIIRKHSDIKLFVSENISISNNRNIGASKAKGENIVFIDSDCLVCDNLLNTAELLLNDFECCGSFYKASDNQGWVAKTWLLAERKDSGVVDWVTGGTLIVKREFFIKIGGFDERLQTEEDEDFCLRLRNNGGKIYNELAMASIHMGQADNIFDFFKKEMWRGKSIVKPIFSSLERKYTIFDIFIIFCFANYCVLFFSIVFRIKIVIFFTFFISLALPLLLSLRKSFYLNKYNYIWEFYLLYHVFILARVTAILKKLFNFRSVLKSN